MIDGSSENINKKLGVAVGFIIKDDCLEKATNLRIIKGVELLEMSIVENPINPDCYIK